MSRPLSRIAPDWWDYTTLDAEIIRDAAALTADSLSRLSRPGFRVVFYDTLEDFYLAEALEYITAWKQAKADEPVGICGPVGPTEQRPLVARLVNELGIDLLDQMLKCNPAERITAKDAMLHPFLKDVDPAIKNMK